MNKKYDATSRLKETLPQNVNTNLSRNAGKNSHFNSSILFLLHLE